MTASRLVAEVLVCAGVVVCVASSLGAALPRRVLDRVHFVTPVTSLGAPLIGVGLMLDTGWRLAAALIGMTTLVVAVTGPVVAAATARVTAEEGGLISPESPQ